MKCKNCSHQNVYRINCLSKDENKLIIKYGELTYCYKCRYKLIPKYIPKEQYKLYWYMRGNNERKEKV